MGGASSSDELSSEEEEDGEEDEDEDEEDGEAGARSVGVNATDEVFALAGAAGRATGRAAVVGAVTVAVPLEDASVGFDGPGAGS